MKKIRAQYKELKEGFLTAKWEKQFPVYAWANAIFIFFIFIIFFTISAIIYNFYEVVGICMIAISTILYIIFMSWNKVFFITMRISARIFAHFFARYGRVVSKDDWERIKKQNKSTYKFIWDKKSIGQCYTVALILALLIEDAKIMYCSIASGEGGPTAHAVVVKNNCVYDTNIRRHYDYDEYIEMAKAEVYQIFEKEIFCRESFLSDVKEDFANWCAKRNVYFN